MEVNKIHNGGTENGKEIRFIELFGGIGGFRAGLERANEGIGNNKPFRKDCGQERIITNPSLPKNRQCSTFRCIYYNDIDKYAVQTYNKNFKENWKPTDIRKVAAKDIPKHDLLTGGFPCQSFSIAGKRKGFEDTRGTLFYDICRIVQYHRPKMLLLENVKGLLSAGIQISTGYYKANKGKPKGEITADRKRVENESNRSWEKIRINICSGFIFNEILLSLSELDYDCEGFVLNSKHFGVPQNRERVFIVGHSRTKSGQKVFPLGEADEKDNGS